MTMEKLKYLADAVLGDLESNVEKNLDRYIGGDFEDLAKANGWSAELQLDVDLGPLSNLDPQVSPEVEIKNSLLIWDVFSKLTPSLASEDRIWTRLTHLEGLVFTRGRWLTGKAKDKDASIAAIKKHFFADTQTKRRDDNAISRLWWNAYIAKLVAPESHELALKALLKTADIRQAVIERPRTASRLSLTAGIVRAMNRDPWLTAAEDNFRKFIKIVNKLGGGELFEVMNPEEIDSLVDDCSARAKHLAA